MYVSKQLPYIGGLMVMKEVNGSITEEDELNGVITQENSLNGVIESG